MNRAVVNNKIRKLDRAFNKWFQEHPEEHMGGNWGKQKRWLSRELLNSRLIDEGHLKSFWSIFDRITKVQYEQYYCGDWVDQFPVFTQLLLWHNEWKRRR